MKKFNRTDIQTLYLAGFIVPPLIWLFMGMYIGIYSLKTITEMNLALPIIYLGSIIGLNIYISKLLSDIELGFQKVGRKFVSNAQRAITYLSRFYLIALPVYGIILPLSSQTNFYALLTFEFFIEWIFGTSIIFIVSTPFFITMLSFLEKATQDVPGSMSYNDLTLDAKFLLISIPNIIGTFLVTVCTYILIFLRNDQNPDVIYILFTKSVILGIILIGIFSFNHIMLRNQILNPVKQLNEFMNNIILSGGNMNVKLKFSNRDEFSSIALNFNRLIEFLMQIINQIDLTSTDVLSSSKKFAQSTKKLIYSTQKEQNSINEISRYNVQLKDINVQLVEASGKSNKDISIITETIHTINEETHGVIQSLEDLTEDIRKTAMNAKAGEKSLSDMRHTMEIIYNTFQDISEIMSFTSEISEKINLLSLNASIEASRAGELGLGFAVVAQQIARLSEETKKNVINIESLLEKSNDKLKVGTDQILKGMQTIVFLLNGVDDIEKIFGKIIFNLKEDIANYDHLEAKVKEIKEFSDTTTTYSGVQNERLQILSDTLIAADQFIKSSLESIKELNTNAEYSLHFAKDLQKKVTLFKVNKSDNIIEEKPAQDGKSAG
jgi:methyl-accepting chemotaxis protein